MKGILMVQVCMQELILRQKLRDISRRRYVKSHAVTLITG